MPRNSSCILVKTKMNLRLDRDLKVWIQNYAIHNRTTISALIRDYFLSIKQYEENQKNEVVEQI